jgi:hypothetical protein
VGWSDQGWAQADEPEWGVADGSEALAARAPARRAAQLSLVLFLVIALAAAGCVAAGQLPRHHPLVPAFSFKLPRLGHRAAAPPASSTIGGGRIEPLGGPPLATDPSTYTLHGRTAATDGLHSTGKVVLRGRWDGGAWLVLARARTDAAGNFQVTTRLHRRGVLELRLMLPDGFIGTKTVRVE